MKLKTHLRAEGRRRVDSAAALKLQTPKYLTLQPATQNPNPNTTKGVLLLLLLLLGY